MIVVDASVALKWVFEEEWSDEAVALLEGDNVIAPRLMAVEAANALWRRSCTGEITGPEARRLLEGLRALPVGYVDEDVLLGDALDLATRLGHPIYDCVYLATALDHDLRLATADLRFARLLRANGFGDTLHLIGRLT